MSCNCVHNKAEIERDKRNLLQFRELFIKRMTIDSEHNDRRRKDYNQAIFGYREDGSTFACWCNMDMEMVLECFDNAMKDYRKTYCDVDNCNRK